MAADDDAGLLMTYDDYAGDPRLRCIFISDADDDDDDDEVAMMMI